MYPDFLGIGAQKSGTTWLHKNFERHPDIWTPPEKELHYFDEKRYEGGGVLSRMFGDRAHEERWRRQIRRQWRRHREEGWDGVGWNLKYFMRRPGDRWYASLFPSRPGLVTGEITPNYSALEEDKVDPIAELIPDLKVIFIMRNPIERAWSHAQMELVRMGHNPTPSEAEFIAHFGAVSSRRLSHYKRTIDIWGDRFPAGQIYLGYLEDIHFRPAAMVRSVYDYLGVAVDDSDVIRRKIHVGGAETMPVAMARHLAELYLPQLRRLHRMLGGHASRWFRMAERLVEDPPAGADLGYPLYQSELWPAVWDKDGPPPFQSGPLTSVERDDG
jgi:hypothetical protein